MSSAEINRSEPGQQNIEPRRYPAEHDGKSVDEGQRADTVQTRDADFLREKSPKAAQPLRPELPLVQDGRKPVPAPEDSDLISKMRDLANVSSTAALTNYRSKVGTRILFQITAIVVLLVTALLLFEFSLPSRFGVYAAALAHWFVALVLCANLPRYVRHLRSDARHSTGTTNLTG